MIVIVEERDAVKDGYTAWFDREGVSATGLCSSDFDSWVKTVSEQDIRAVEAFLLGDCLERNGLPKLIRGRSDAPVIAMNDNKSLDETLDLFAAGVDDVVRKPVHVREILARIKAIRARVHSAGEGTLVGQLRVFSDGRDPEVKDEVLPLPRREWHASDEPAQPLHVNSRSPHGERPPRGKPRRDVEMRFAEQR